MLKKYLKVNFVVLGLIMFFALTQVAQAEFDLTYERARYNPETETLNVKIVISSSNSIKDATFKCWGEDQTYTYDLPENLLNKPTLHFEINLEKGQFSLDKTRYLQLVAKDDNKEEFTWKTEVEFLKPWKQLENEYITLRYKVIDDHRASQIFDMAKEIYTEISNILRIDLDHKIDIVLLSSYEHACKENPTYLIQLIVQNHYNGLTGPGMPINILFQNNPQELKRILAHEMTHQFLNTLLFTDSVGDGNKAKIDESVNTWFNESMCQYLAHYIVFGDSFLNTFTDSVDEEVLQESLSFDYWMYDLQMSSLFFSYLYDQYETTDIGEAIVKFSESEEFKVGHITQNLLTYLTTKYSINLDKTKIGLDYRTQYYYKSQYNHQFNKILMQLRASEYYSYSINYDIGVFDLNNGKLTNLTENYYFESDPIWAHNPEEIYFIQQAGLDHFIAKMNLKSGNIQKLYTTAEPILDIALSPNGETIAFAQQRDLYHSSIWLLHINNGIAEEITSGEFYDKSPYFQTDKELFYVSDRKDDSSRICRFNLANFQINSVPNTNNAVQIVDIENNRLLFSQGIPIYPSLHLLDLDSGGNTQLFNKLEYSTIKCPELSETGLLYLKGDLTNLSEHELKL